VLREQSKVEQRYDAVMGVIKDGLAVTEVAEKFGVTRQSLHAWLRRYEAGGIEALADRSHRPRSVPHQINGAAEARVLELRRLHPFSASARSPTDFQRRATRRLPPRAGSIGPWSDTASSSPRPGASASSTTSVGNAAVRWSCGRWTSWAGSC